LAFNFFSQQKPKERGWLMEFWSERDGGRKYVFISPAPKLWSLSLLLEAFISDK